MGPKAAQGLGSPCLSGPSTQLLVPPAVGAVRGHRLELQGCAGGEAVEGLAWWSL